ncbi:Uncharacterized protein family UPF0250, YbeD-like [Dillenia turbinata]|uniref:Uncharacterized protein family UPF0250, YbeD-like n=1 Tax=Dillenia turbinata TaxID=194707 RepID=A0AAN8Z2T0_9MAGN
MACNCRTVMRSVFITEPWSRRPLHDHHHPPSSSTLLVKRPIRSRSSFGFNALRISRVRSSNLRPTTSTNFVFNCSYSDGNGTPSPQEQDDQGPPQEAVLKAISEVSKTEGRVGQTTNVVIGGTVTDDSTNEWLALDQKVNSYPTVRGFTAIGTGGDDFVQAMVFAVESVIQQPIPEGRVRQKVSSRGKYVSVNIGPVRVISSEQVQAVYNAMRRDDRMKYFL